VAVAEADDEFAGELSTVNVPRRASAIGPRLVAACASGVVAGLLPSAIVLLVYFLRNADAPLPWIRVATILAVYGPGIGVLLAGFVELFVLATDRIARIGFGLVAVFNPVTAGGLGGMLAGIAPGAVGVVVFGSYHGPFVGTGLIAFGLIAGSVMVAVPAARRARRARGIADNRRVIAAATIGATLILCAVAAVVAPVIVGSAFDEARNSVDDYGGIIGAVAGALGGTVVGVFIGIVIALARVLRSSAARPRNRTSPT
jgi:hypothetical protein